MKHINKNTILDLHSEKFFCCSKYFSAGSICSWYRVELLLFTYGT